MLLTSLLSSACSLAVPSAAQKHYASGGNDQHGTLSASSSSSTVVVGTTSSPATLLHQVDHRKQHGINHRRPVEPTGGSSSQEDEYGQHDHPDLYNLTLTAMRQYLRNHLNASRYGKAPRKRSHLHVDDVDVEFYRRFKEFNSSQAVLGHSVPVALNNSQPKDPDLESGNDGPVEPLPSVANVTPVPAVSSSVAPPGGTTGQRDYSVLMDDPRGYITVPSSFPMRPGKTSTTWNSTFAQHRGYIYGLVFSVICVLVLGLFGVFRCLRATTTATRATTEALTLPIQFIADDLAPLNANLNHLPVPMLSVQSPGCAGMERLGVPARGSIGSPPLRNERAGFHHQQQSQQQQQQQQQQSQQQNPQQQQQQQQLAQQQQPSAQQNHHRHHHHHNHHHHPHQYHQQVTSPTGRLSGSDLILSSTTSSNFRSNHNQSYLFIPHQTNSVVGGGSSGSSSINYKTQYSNSSYGGSSIGSSSASSNPVTTSFPLCPYHVALPDGEYGQDRDLRIRTPCQQEEIPRTYVKAPPNKTVRDVPVQYQTAGGITAHGTTMTSGGSTGTFSHAHTMGEVVSYYGSPKTTGRSADGGRLAATTPGPSLGTATTTTCAQKPVDKLQKIFRFLPGKATKSSTSSSSSPSSSSSSSSSTSSSCSGGIKHTSSINNNHQGAGASCYGGLQPLSAAVSPGSSTTSLNNNGSSSSTGVGHGSISGSYGPSSSCSVISSNHVNNNRVGCGGVGGSSTSSNSNAVGNIRVDGRGGLSLATPGAGIHNHNQHYRSPSAAVSSSLASPTSSTSASTSSSSSPTSATIARSSSDGTGPVVSGSSSDPGHAPFTM